MMFLLYILAMHVHVLLVLKFAGGPLTDPIEACSCSCSSNITTETAIERERERENVLEDVTVMTWLPLWLPLLVGGLEHFKTRLSVTFQDEIIRAGWCTIK